MQIGNMILLRRIVLVWFVVMGLAVFGQPLMELGTGKVDTTALRKLYAGPQARQTAKTAASSNALTAQETRKLIVVNPTTLDNAVLSLANGVDETTLKVTPLLLAELRNAGLDYAEAYDCIVADVMPSGEYASRDLVRVGIPDRIRMPQFRYGRKGDVRLAAQSERKIRSVGLNVPMPIFASEVSDEEFQRAFEKNRQLAMENAWYSYEYVLPNGDLTTYTDFGDEDTTPDPSCADAINAENSQAAEIQIADWTGSIMANDSGRIVTYKIEPLSSDAKASMRAGMKCWNGVLKMKIPVIAKVGFTGDYVSQRTLGSSFSPDTYQDESVGIAYPAALIDQILGEDMHPSADYDIRIIYNKKYTFYYGESASCPSTQIDFQTIVTHELCHGLGFSSYHYRGYSGSSPDGTWLTTVPSIFDTFLYYSTGRLPSLTQAMRKTAFTSDALYWDGGNAKAANGGSRVKMYAPPTYSSGSSVSHWDDSVTFTTFMKYSVSSGVVLRDIDSRLRGAFKDMGWELKDDVPPTYNVVYNKGTYGTGSQQTATKTKGVALALKGAIFTRTGYRQTGWSRNADGSTKDYNPNASYTTDAAVTLYPFWTPNSYSVSYVLGDNAAQGTTHPDWATYDKMFYVSAPTRSGYTFAGWTVTSGLNKSTAKWGTGSSPATAIGSTSTICVNGATGNVYFKNLTPNAKGSVTLTANWTAIATVKVGEVQKLDYIGMMGGTTYVLWLENSTRGFLVEDAWFEEAGIDISGGVTPAVMNAIGRNGIPRYESLLLGLDPESSVPAEEQLHPTITFDATGKPVISCFPRKESKLVIYTTLGKSSLNSSEWVKVTDNNRAQMKFFKVKVELAK